MSVCKKMVKTDIIYTVYCLHNKCNDNKYVGITTRGIEKRLKDHREEMLRDRSSHKKIYRAISIVIIVLLAFFVGYMVYVGRMIG